MSKGVVTTTPTQTHTGKLTVIVADDNTYDVGFRSLLDFPVNDQLTLNVKDAVEFTIRNATECEVTGVLASPRGKVTLSPVDGRGGKCEITEPNPNNFGVKKGDVSWFSALDPALDPIPDSVIEGNAVQVILTSAPGPNGPAAIFVKAL